MRRIFTTLLVILVSFNIVFAESIPPFPLTSGCSGIGSGSFYDCFVNFFLYWLGFPETTQTMNFFGAFNFKVLGRQNYWERNWGPPRFLMDIFVPFVAVFLVTFGFMSRLKIFGRGMDWINVVLSVLMILFIGRVHIFGYFVGIIFTIGPIYAFGIWALLFFTGIWFLYIKARASMGTEAGLYKTYKTEIDELNREIKDIRARKDELMRRIAVEDNEAKIGKLQAAYESLDEREGKIHARKKDLKQTFEE